MCNIPFSLCNLLFFRFDSLSCLHIINILVSLFYSAALLSHVFFPIALVGIILMIPISSFLKVLRLTWEKLSAAQIIIRARAPLRGADWTSNNVYSHYVTPRTGCLLGITDGTDMDQVAKRVNSALSSIQFGLTFLAPGARRHHWSETIIYIYIYISSSNVIPDPIIFPTITNYWIDSCGLSKSHGNLPIDGNNHRFGPSWFVDYVGELASPFPLHGRYSGQCLRLQPIELREKCRQMRGY